MIKESKILKNISILAFIGIEMLMLLLIVFIKVKNTGLFCYLSVIIAFVFSLLFTVISQSNIKVLAILCTLLADLFLVLLRINNYQTYGMVFFVIAQIVYAIYLFNSKRDYFKIKLLIRLFINIMMIVVSIIILKEKTDLLSIISIIYFANLISSIIICLFNIKDNYLFLIGLLMLILCDIHVGLISADGIYLFYNPDSFIVRIIYANFNYTWFFYILSLVFISLSILFESKKYKIS